MNAPRRLPGAALLTDYILTVAVSISSGAAQIVSALPSLARWRVELAVAAIILMMLVNLRGLRESGTVFAVPTYFFVLAMLAMLGIGFYELLAGRLPQVTGVRLAPAATQPFTLFLLLRAFSSGAVAVTGTEAVSNGIPAFRDPKSRNAAATMAWMSALIGIMFIGTTVLAHRTHALPTPDETVISQLARTVYGPGLLHLTTLAATTLILILAANTAFADFPRLAALHATDGYLPRQLMNRGSRLVFSSGIATLSVIAAALVIIFRANVSALIPLYAVGVFLSFTMSQAGMIVHWRRTGGLPPEAVVRTRGSILRHDPRWRGKLAVNAFGTLLTGVVVGVLAVTKFTQGAWIVVILIPAVVAVFFRIHRHYQYVARQLSLRALTAPPDTLPVAHLVLVPDVHAAAVREVQFVRSLGGQWTPLHVEIEPEKTEGILRKWRQLFPGHDLVVLPSPLRDVAGPVREYVEHLHAARPDTFIHVVTSQILADNLFQQVLHQNTTITLKLALQHIPMVVVSDVAYPLHPREPVAVPGPPGRMAPAEPSGNAAPAMAPAAPAEPAPHRSP